MQRYNGVKLLAVGIALTYKTGSSTGKFTVILEL